MDHCINKLREAFAKLEPYEGRIITTRMVRDLLNVSGTKAKKLKEELVGKELEGHVIKPVPQGAVYAGSYEDVVYDVVLDETDDEALAEEAAKACRRGGGDEDPCRCLNEALKVLPEEAAASLRPYFPSCPSGLLPNKVGVKSGGAWMA